MKLIIDMNSKTFFFILQPIPYEEDPYGRSMRYRELPAHRMPQYEDEVVPGKVDQRRNLFPIALINSDFMFIFQQRRVRPTTREVIVQPVTRADDWNDPWMRSGKSPTGVREKRQKRDRRSYSSNSSYSSSR